MRRQFPVTELVRSPTAGRLSALGAIDRELFRSEPTKEVSRSLSDHAKGISKTLSEHIEISGFPCPHCRHTITVECLHASVKPKNNAYLDVRIAVKCKSCNSPFLLLATWNMEPIDGYYKIPPASQMNWKTKPESTDTVFAEQQKWQSAGVPQAAIGDYIEGLKCMSFGLLKAAFLMFGSALERLFSAGQEEARNHLSELISKQPDLSEDVKAFATSGAEARNFYAHRVQQLPSEEQEEHARHMSILVEYLANEMYMRKSSTAKAVEALDKMSGHKSEECKVALEEAQETSNTNCDTD